MVLKIKNKSFINKFVELQYLRFFPSIGYTRGTPCVPTAFSINSNLCDIHVVYAINIKDVVLLNASSKKLNSKKETLRPK